MHIENYLSVSVIIGILLSFPFQYLFFRELQGKGFWQIGSCVICFVTWPITIFILIGMYLYSGRKIRTYMDEENSYKKQLMLSINIKFIESKEFNMGRKVGFICEVDKRDNFIMNNIPWGYKMCLICEKHGIKSKLKKVYREEAQEVYDNKVI